MAAHWPETDVGIAAHSFRHQRHHPENTLVYQLVADLYPHFLAQLEQEDR